MKLQIKVKPNARQQKIEEAADGSLKVFLKSPPIDGKANQELIKLLSQKYGVSQSQIQIKCGGRSSHKIIEIQI